jgi:epsilon-lactone hydrolase
MGFKSKILYKMMLMGKENFQKAVDGFNVSDHTLEKDIARANAVRESSHHFDRIVSLMSTPPEDVTLAPTMKNGVKTVLATPKGHNDQAILYIHGGAWIIGMSNIHKMFCAHVAKTTQAPVWVVDYRLSPEYPFPAGLDDCFAVYQAMLQEGLAPNKITIMGESAGGNLVLALLLKIKQENLPMPGAAIPLSPITDLNMEADSYTRKGKADPVLAHDYHKSIHFTYLRGASPDNPLVSPLFGDLKGLPPILIIVGEQEILLDDSINFAERAKQAGVDVTLDVHEELFHVYPLFYDILDDAKVALGKIALFIQMKTGQQN